MALLEQKDFNGSLVFSTDFWLDSETNSSFPLSGTEWVGTLFMVQLFDWRWDEFSSHYRCWLTRDRIILEVLVVLWTGWVTPGIRPNRTVPLSTETDPVWYRTVRCRTAQWKCRSASSLPEPGWLCVWIIICSEPVRCHTMMLPPTCWTSVQVRTFWSLSSWLSSHFGSNCCCSSRSPVPNWLQHQTCWTFLKNWVRIQLRHLTNYWCGVCLHLNMNH